LSKRSPSAERLYRARKAAAKELKLPVTDWRVRRFALLMVAHDNVTARLANGADVSVDNLLKVDAAMQEIRASMPPEPMSLDLHFVDGVTGIFNCQHCGQRNEIPDHHPLREPDAPPIPPPDKKPTSEPAAAVAVPSGGNVVPLKWPAEQTAGPSFHGVYEPWRAFVGPVGGGSDPFHVGPFPPGGRQW
jgi:hypothetical protein